MVDDILARTEWGWTNENLFGKNDRGSDLVSRECIA